MDTELVEENALGVKKAAQRKLLHELGIRNSQVCMQWHLCLTNIPLTEITCVLFWQISVDDFTYLTRIHYKSDNVPFDGKWGEHEIDYILFAQKDVDVIPNDNEVKAYKYVSQDDLKTLIGGWILSDFILPIDLLEPHSEELICAFSQVN